MTAEEERVADVPLVPVVVRRPPPKRLLRRLPEEAVFVVAEPVVVFVTTSCCALRPLVISTMVSFDSPIVTGTFLMVTFAAGTVIDRVPNEELPVALGVLLPPPNPPAPR